MFGVHKEKIGDVSVISCKGRMVGGDAALELRDEVRRQEDASVVLLDLSELVSLGRDVMGSAGSFGSVDSGPWYPVQVVRSTAWRAARPAAVTFDC